MSWSVNSAWCLKQLPSSSAWPNTASLIASFCVETAGEDNKCILKACNGRFESNQATKVICIKNVGYKRRRQQEFFNYNLKAGKAGTVQHGEEMAQGSVTSYFIHIPDRRERR